MLFKIFDNAFGCGFVRNISAFVLLFGIKRGFKTEKIIKAEKLINIVSVVEPAITWMDCECVIAVVFEKARYSLEIIIENVVAYL